MKFKKYRKKINIRGSLTSKILKVGSLNWIKSGTKKRIFGVFLFESITKYTPFLQKLTRGAMFLFLTTYLLIAS